MEGRLGLFNLFYGFPLIAKEEGYNCRTLKNSPSVAHVFIWHLLILYCIFPPPKFLNSLAAAANICHLKIRSLLQMQAARVDGGQASIIPERADIFEHAPDTFGA